jgi:hypothetical protein
MSSDLMNLINSMVNNSKNVNQIVYNKSAMQDAVQGLRQLADAAIFTANSFQKLLISEHSSHDTFSSNNARSYANAVFENNNVSKPNTSNKQNVSNSFQPHFNAQHASKNLPNNNAKVVNDSNKNSFILSELALLKNTRNTSAYAAQRNVMLSKIFEENLNKFPKRVPKKFAPSFNRNDAPAIRDLKTKSSINKVKDEIDKMKIHADIQKNKRDKFEKLCFEYIERETNSEKRQKLLNDLKNIIKKTDEASLKKINSKIHFFNSNEYMSTINSFTNTNTSIRKQNTSLQTSHTPEDTDPDDVSEQEEEMPVGQPVTSPSIVDSHPENKSAGPEPSYYCSQPDEHQLKRKGDSLESDTSHSETNVPLAPSTQPDRACKSLVPFVPYSKNGVTSNNRKKKKKKFSS